MKEGTHMGDSMVLHRSFYSPALNSEKGYCIYLPPSYRHRPDFRYSTVYLLPGLMDWEMTWCEKGRVHEQMDHLIYSGKIGEMIVVMPDKDDASHRHGDAGRAVFGRYLGQDLLGHIDYEFNTIPHRSHRGIEGLSLGASWALTMAVWAPELYSSIGALSGGASEEIYHGLWEKQEYLRQLGMRFRIGVGAWEPEFIGPNQHLAEYLRSLGFYCEFSVDEGPHDWPLWRKQIHDSLQFHFYSFNPVHV
jgi:enterochelin esterase-like enzyme